MLVQVGVSWLQMTTAFRWEGWAHRSDSQSDPRRQDAAGQVAAAGPGARAQDASSIEREREMYVNVHTYIYIYIYTHNDTDAAVTQRRRRQEPRALATLAAIVHDSR